MNLPLRPLPLLLLIAVLPLPATGNPSPEKIEFFESRIRPILAQECYECHSEATKSKGGLLLDTRAGWQKGGDSGEPVILPGRPDESLLLQSIAHEIEDLKMPKAGAKLEDSVLADFRKWISDGAFDPRDTPPSGDQLEKDTNWEAIRERRKGWWSFQPIEAPNVPGVPEADHPVDRFLLAAMKKGGLAPAGRADPQTLHRRLTYTLTGLPPTPGEADAFLEAWENDPDKAIQSRVDRLLSDPGFGEKWARHWMDWLRYADSHGSEGDPTIPHSWQYRDYLVRALNRDVPYDQLVREHLAGDLLADPRINPELAINESAIGPAHLRMVFHGFAPTDALDERVRFTDDQINTVTKAFLGLTVSCARCHDHKFDAISQADYYALFGIFTSPLPATVAIDAPGVLEKNRKELAGLKPVIRKQVAAGWLAHLQKGQPDWSAAIKEKGKQSGLVQFLRAVPRAGNVESAWAQAAASFREKSEQASAHRSGKTVRRHWDLSNPSEAKQWTREGEGLAGAPATAPGEFIVGTGKEVIDRILPGGVFSHTLSSKHRGFLASPPFLLDGEYDLYLHLAGEGSSARFSVQHYPRSGTVYPVTNLSSPDWNWTSYHRVDYWKGDHIHLELATAGEAPILVQEKERSWFGIREAFLVEKGSPAPGLPDEGLSFLLRPGTAPKTTEEAHALVHRALLDAVGQWEKGTIGDPEARLLDEALRAGLLPNRTDAFPAELAQQIARYRDLENAIPTPTRAPGLVERPGRDQPLYDRGNHKKPLEPVSRRFLEAIDETPYQTPLSGRLEFAEDLLREDNPFTARVIVNRVWHHLFGNGLVASTDNFGRLGEPPSHPGLLDHLASKFRSDWNWSLKTLIRELIQTDAWQRSSVPSPEAEATDPDNRLLSHYPLRRLDAEAIRDSMLAVSGRLDRTRYGPSVTGTAPRRSLYLRVKRNNLDPFLTTFDFPTPASTVGSRNSTNVPAQSLTLLNDSFVQQQAREWAATLPADADEKTRIELLFERALNRPPNERERTGARDFLYTVKQEHGTSLQQFRDAERSLQSARAELEELLSPVRSRLLAAKKAASDSSEAPPANTSPVPAVARWDFEKDLNDGIRGLSATAHGSARLENGALLVDGGGFVATEPLPFDLEEKTLEAVVQLDTLQQAGGGVVTVQDLRGILFDSIVFAERKPNEWLAGSNNHRRTLDFGAEPDKEAASRPVRIAMTFAKDGTIRAFRDGKPWGDPIRKADLQPFPSGESQVVFGLRHGTGIGGNKALRGKIFEASLYDRALNPSEIAAISSGNPTFVSEREVREALPEAGRNQHDALLQRIEALEGELTELRKTGADQSPDDRPWQDLAHAIFNLKEFIYLH